MTLLLIHQPLPLDALILANPWTYEAAAETDGIVVGTALVERLDREGPEAAAGWVAGLRRALDAG